MDGTCRYEFIEDVESKGVLYKYGNGTYRPEETAAFVLSYAKQIAEKHAGASVKDCVITVPPFFRHEARPPPCPPSLRPSTLVSMIQPIDGACACAAASGTHGDGERCLNRRAERACPHA